MFIDCHISNAMRHLLILVSLTTAVLYADRCQPTSWQDIRDAAVMARDIYEKKVQVGKNAPGTKYKVKQIREVKYLGQPLKAIVAEKSPSTTMICFMGTSTANQLLHQFKSSFTYQWAKLNVNGNKFRVLKYFSDALKKLNMMKYIRVNPRTRYIVTGHSLGGALAHLYSMDMVKIQWKHPGSRLITFGGPRVGDKTFSRAHDKLIPAWKKLRIVYNKDPVVRVPTNGWLNKFLHASREIWIERKTRYYWAGWFRWKKRTSHKWHVCPVSNGRKPEKSCSNKIYFARAYVNLGDHKMSAYVSQVEKLGRDRNALNKFLNALC